MSWPEQKPMPWFTLSAHKSMTCEVCGDVFLSDKQPKPCVDCKGPASPTICDDCVVPADKIKFPPMPSSEFMIRYENLGRDEHLCEKCSHAPDIKTTEST